MDEMSCDCEDNEMWSMLFETPAAKLMQALEKAEKFIEEKEPHKAHRELIQCTALTRIIYGSEHWKLAQAHSNLAFSYLTLQGLPLQAMQHANSAQCTIFSGKGILPESPEEKSEILSTLLTIYYTLGVAQLMQKKGKESYCNLQKAVMIMEELQKPDWKRTPEVKVSEKDLFAALGRTTLQQNKLVLAARYFEKAIDAVISTKGETTPELINLYQEIAQTEQLKKNHMKYIAYLLQAHSVALAVHQKFSAETASVALLLGKAYAATGEEKHAKAAEMYFNESVASHKLAWGPDHCQTINALEDFSKWLISTGKNKQAFDLLEESFQSQSDPCSDFNEKAAERYYIMGCICLAEGKIKEAYQLFNKCEQIQVAVYGLHHKKSKEMQKLLDMLKMSPVVLEETRHKQLKRALACNGFKRGLDKFMEAKSINGYKS